MLDYSLELISDQPQLAALVGSIHAAPALALDIETVNWWDREAERVSLLQLAFREGEQPRVAVIDALAGLDLEPLRGPLELSATTKAIHNAVYDAPRLSRHFRIYTSPIHDTMLAARRGGERRCSLQAQASAHLGLQLDKHEQRSDWGRRPLAADQLRYAALDAACTLLLYEHQVGRGLRGDYQLRPQTERRQSSLPLRDVPAVEPGLKDLSEAADGDPSVASDLSVAGLALLGVITELAGRYGPDHLAVSVGSERVGLAGWIIDRALGAEADLDEGSARLEIQSLCARGLVQLNSGRKLEATDLGRRIWQQVKP